MTPLESDWCIQTKPGEWINTRDTCPHFEGGIEFRLCWKRGLKGCLDYWCFTLITCCSPFPPPPFFFSFSLKMMGKGFVAILLPTKTVWDWRNCRSVHVAAKEGGHLFTGVPNPDGESSLTVPQLKKLIFSNTPRSFFSLNLEVRILLGLRLSCN